MITTMYTHINIYNTKMNFEISPNSHSISHTCFPQQVHLWFAVVHLWNLHEFYQKCREITVNIHVKMRNSVKME